jgi:hypothetical protein
MSHVHYMCSELFGKGKLRLEFSSGIWRGSVRRRPSQSILFPWVHGYLMLYPEQSKAAVRVMCLPSGRSAGIPSSTSALFKIDRGSYDLTVSKLCGLVVQSHSKSALRLCDLAMFWEEAPHFKPSAETRQRRFSRN